MARVNSFGQWLRATREAAGYTGTEMLLKIAQHGCNLVSKQTYYAWERDERWVNKAYRDAIFDILGIPPAERVLIVAAANGEGRFPAVPEPA